MSEGAGTSGGQTKDKTEGSTETGTPACPVLGDALLGKTVSEEVATHIAQAQRERWNVDAADVTLDGLLEYLTAWTTKEHNSVDAFVATLPAALTAFQAGALVGVAKRAVPAPWGTDTGLPTDPGTVYARVLAPYTPRDRAHTSVLRVTFDPSAAAATGGDAGAVEVPLECVTRLPPAVCALIEGSGSSASGTTATDRLVWDAERAARVHVQRTVERGLLAAVEARGTFTAAEARVLADVFLADVPAAVPAYAAGDALERAEGALRALAADEAALSEVAARSRSAAGPAGEAAVPAAGAAAMARDAARAYLGVLATVREHARDVVETVRSGARKRELTRWYLDVVHRAADALLAARGFAPDAVPADYTERPPASLAAVRRNLAACRAVLAGRTALPDVAAALARTCGAVYARLDALAVDTMQVLRLDMGLAAADAPAEAPADAPRFVAAAQEALRRAEAAGEPRVRAWKNTLADIEYITEMHRRESMDGAAASMDIVPVSGLLLGRITRIENEMQTVLLIWDKPGAPDSPAGADAAAGGSSGAPGTPPAHTGSGHKGDSAAKPGQLPATQRRSFFRSFRDKRKDTS